MNKDKITLKNILGYKEEKESVQKIITLLNNYEKYSKMGVSIPRGLIFQGPPGTGKTLFAKAIAGECNYKFFTALEDNTNDEPLKVLKKVFKDAESYSNKNNSPSLIYIDEIDKIAHLNHHGELSDKESREATRFLLQKLDETKLKNRILIIASTNNYNKIPQALLRSGRFDKKILIDVPNAHSRVEILKYYINNNPLFKDINLFKLAIKTRGMSCADLKTLINNTMVEYITTKKTIKDDDFIKVINEMHFETIGKEWETSSKILEVLVHELGHSIVSGELCNDYGEISAIRYGDVGGFTELNSYEDVVTEESDLTDNVNQSFEDNIKELSICLGGVAAEKVILHRKSLGGGSDINRVFSIVRMMCDLGAFGFEYSTLGMIPETLREKVTNLTVKLARKAFRKSCRIVRKNKYLLLYMMNEIHKHNDVMSSTQVRECVDYYKNNTKEIKKQYRHFKIEEFK